ncbi:MAG: DUF885 domain-containing protein [Armatimonadetes bacterium]|nr:DUF885 domain-containing protein [Armatimonadota bacterium]MDW8154145.1 DUF885 domain-containing protein [Armatimonadota bacterium]
MYGDFETTVTEILQATFDFYPLWASGLGLHAYDGVAGRYDLASLDARLRDLRTAQRALEAVDPNALSPEQHLDLQVLRAAVEKEQFEIAELREFERNPILYTAFLDTTHYLKRAYAPLDQRLERLAEYQRQVPGLLETARRNLVGPCARPHVQVAMEIFEGMLRYLEHNLPRAAAGASPAVRSRLLEANAQAAAAVRAFLGFLQEEVLPKATEAFALGAPLYRRMLWVGERLDLDLQALREIGEQELLRLREAVEEAGRRLAPGRSPAEVVRMLAEEHPSEEELLPLVRALVEELRAFLEERDVVTLPVGDRLHVEPTPPFLRWAFALMDTAGPFEETSTDSYYYLTLPEADWSPQQKEEWMRRFDPYTLRNTTVHEVYPGHYVHFLHLRRLSSRVRRVFHAYSFVEGWAHYAEEMLVEQGYGGEKLRLAQLLDALLRAVRLVVSIGMHTEGMTVAQAVRRFREDAYLEPLPAYWEAQRGTFDPGYLNYTLGKLMLHKLRRDYESERGGAFRLREFHDRLLQLGAPPIPVARQALLRNPGGSLL